MNIGFAITGSFCTHEKIVEIIKDLKDKGHNVLPIFSDSVALTDTRFGSAKDFKANITKASGNAPVSTLVEVEPLGPQNLMDVLVVAPCTGNTLAKLANSITDTPVVMAAKSHLRNNKPLVIAVSTNDALGGNFKNIATLMNAKSVYFVPFRQDSPTKKPKSIIADYSKIYETILNAMENKQIQPVLLTEKMGE